MERYVDSREVDLSISHAIPPLSHLPHTYLLQAGHQRPGLEADPVCTPDHLDLHAVGGRAVGGGFKGMVIVVHMQDRVRGRE